MTHMYRAVWTDNSLNVIGVASEEFSLWLTSRGTPIPIELGKSVTVGQRTATWVESKSEAGHVMQMHLKERLGGIQGTWVTVLTVIWTNSENILWADVHIEDPQVWTGVVHAPRVVRNLLLAGGDPRIGRDSIEVQPREIDDQKSVTALLTGLRDVNREIPYLVVRLGEGSQRTIAVQRATRSCETLAGLARVFMVDEESATLLNGILRPHLEIEALGAQLFMPGVMDNPQNARLSFHVSEDELDDDQKTLGRMILRRIALTSQWPEIPAHWKVLKLKGDDKRKSVTRAHAVSTSSSPDSTNEIAFPILADPVEILRLRREIEDLQNQALNAGILAEEANDKAREQKEKADNFRDQMVGELVRVPIGSDFRRGSIAAVIATVRQQAHHIVIPQSAERDIDVLDRTYTAKPWAHHVADFFVAIEKFAKESINHRFSGDFFAWCTDDQDGGFSANKVSMQESIPTMQNPDLVAAHTFEVSRDLNSSGKMVMVAHAKIQIRGGGNIPRIFFYDDTKGPTRKVHIGFIGPHDLVPTSSF